MRTFPYLLSINSSTELGDWNGGKSLIQLKRLPVNRFDEISGKICPYQEKCVFSHMTQ